MSAPTFDLLAVMKALADPAVCRFRTGIQDGALLDKCPGGGRPSVVTLACEHEHFFNVALCRTHQDEVRTALLGCPECNAAVGEPHHRCRHAVVGGAR